MAPPDYGYDNDKSAYSSHIVVYITVCVSVCDVAAAVYGRRTSTSQ